MEATDTKTNISAEPIAAVQTDADSTSSKGSNRDAWQRVIDDTLVEWGRDPGSLEDDGADPPSRITIQRAFEVAQFMRDKDWTPPDTVACDLDGGIVFRRRIGNNSEVVHIWEDGEVDLQRFVGTTLVSRMRDIKF